MTELPIYTYERVFDAPLDLLWRTWTEPELLSSWYGPGVETIIHKFDLRAGGVWLNEMKWGDKSDLSKMAFQDVIEKEKLVWLHSSTDENWNVQPNQMMPDWPLVLLTTVTFKEKGARTSVRLTQVPVDATDAEISCFAKMMAGMDGGWGKGFDILKTMLSDLLAQTSHR